MSDRVDIPESPQPSPPFGIIEREIDAATSVIAVEGELDLTTAPRLKWMLLDSLQAHHTQLVVDLTGTTFMDSTALGVLVGVTRNLEGGARLALVCTRPNVLKIFELSGMDGVFTILGTLEDALEFARGHAARAS